MIKAAIFSLLFFFSFATSDEVLKLEKWIKSVDNVVVEFTQKTYISDLEEWQEFKGKIYIKKPKAKIVYEPPFNQNIVVKPDEILIYSKQENQLIILDKNQDMFVIDLANLLTANSKLENIFNITKTDPKRHTISLTYKKNPESMKIIIKTNESGQIKQIFVEDESNNKVIFNIEKIHLDKVIDMKLNLNKETEIIDYRGKK